MHFTKAQNIEAYALAIDFEKAFDSVDWNYLWEALEAYNIPKSFINMVKLLYNDIDSCVSNNGTSTTYFKIKRGVRQGDPIAAYLFTLAIELLAINIRENQNIVGITVNKTSIKLSMYADDMTGLVVGIKSIEELMKTISEFKIYSGLGVNKDKTELMPLGTSNKDDPSLINLGYKIVTEMKITGVVFTYDEVVKMNKNFSTTLANMEKILNMWKQRNLSIIGKVQISKTYSTSQLIFITNMINTPINITKQANSILHKFLWNGPDKVKRQAMISDIAQGGLKMPHFDSILKTQKIMWAKRYANSNYHPWKEFLNVALNENFGGVNILNRLLSEKTIKKSKMSDFNKEVLITWNTFQNIPITAPEIGNQYLWSNYNIVKPNGTPLNSQRLSKIGINYIKDIIVDQKIMSIKDINTQNFTIFEKLELSSVRNCLPKGWKERIYNLDDIGKFGKKQQDEIKKLKSKTVYNKIIQKITIPPSSETFFKENFDVSNEDFERIYSLPFKATIYTKLRAFQFKINHNILYTNEKLHRIKISESPSCSLCNEEIETLAHLFVDCRKVQIIWNNVIEHFLQPFGVSHLTKKEIVLGFDTKDHQNNVINHIILETKYYIYLSKLEKCMPNFCRLKNRMKITENIEQQIATKNDQIIKHTYKWHHLFNYLLN